MTLTQMEFVKAVATAGSFSAAARACHVSQPSLSTAVAKLEAELGGPLFTRTTRRVDRTRLGESLVPLIDSVLESVRHLQTAAEATRAPGLRPIRLGMSPLVSTPLLAAALKPFERHPSTPVILKQCFLEDLRQRFEQRTIDLAVVPAGFFGRGYERCAVYADPLQYLPCEGTTQDKGPISLREIARETFVLTADGCGLTPFVKDLFRRHRHSIRAYPGVALNHQVIEEWVALGLGAGLLPSRKLTRVARRTARPVVLGRAARPVMIRFELVWLTRAASGPEVTALIRHFRTIVPKIVSGLAIVP